jgi:uncharacterized protein YbjT (DUF2867 family)
MATSILVTGGTGTLGRLVLPRLRASDAQLRVLSRTPRPTEDGVEYVAGDLNTGAGVDAAVDGIDTIVHLAGSAKGDGAKAATLVRAATRAGHPHIVYISVVGADRVPVSSALDRALFGYFASKRAAEVIIETSGLPWTTLRATQFHELILIATRAMARLPVAMVPAGLRFQPVAADEVAARMVELTAERPAGLVPDLAGPETYGMDELVQTYLRATHRRRPIVRVPMMGRAYRAIRGGANLAPDRAVGKLTWEEFLSDQAS